MSKHLHWKIKYNYLMRYYDGETPSSLGKELREKGLINVSDKNVSNVIHRYNNQYKRLGIEGLKSRSGKKSTGRPPKDPNDEKDKFEGWTREQIIEHYRYLEEWLEKLKDDKKMMYHYIDTHTYASKSMLCKWFEVSRSGYYNWIKLGKNITGKYDEVLIEQIKYLFHFKNKKFGFRRIKVLLEREFEVFINERTVRRYMLHLGLRADIRQRRRAREVKITKRTFPDLIKRDFKTDVPYNKLFTDVSYIRTSQGWAYLSVVLDTFNNEIISWEFSKHNDNEFVYNNIKDAMLNVEDYGNVIIHSDHGYQYFSYRMKKLRDKLGIKQSMGRVGVSLDNRPVEYFFSILKQEYLFRKPTTYEKTRELISSSIYDYNNERFQGCLENKTPTEYKFDKCQQS